MIDALDEAADGDRNYLVELLARHAGQLPQWLGLVVTSRPEYDIVREIQVEGVQRLDLETHGRDNAGDMKEYVEANAKVSGRDGRRVVDKLLERSAGNFLYARCALSLLNDGAFDPGDPEVLPAGLDGIFWHMFSRQFRDARTYSKKQAPLLELVAAALAPLPVALVEVILGWTGHERIELVGSLGMLFPMRGSALQPFHRSVVEWLSSESLADRYWVDDKIGHEKLATFLWRCYRIEGCRAISGYGEHLAEHLQALDTARLNRALAPIADETLKALDELRDWFRNGSRFTKATVAARLHLRVVRSLRGPEHPDTILSLHTLAGLLQESGDLKGGESAYRDLVEILEKVRDPDHPETAVVLLTDFGSLLCRQYNFSEAERLLRRALPILEATYGTNHPFTAASLNPLALVLQAKGDLAGAEPLFRRVLEIQEKEFGLEHPLTATGLQNLASILEARIRTVPSPGIGDP